MISTRILADSVNPLGVRLTSWLLTYPRFIHAELMTHRVMSRNAASSRAIPIQKLLDMVRGNPAYPERWGARGKGMQDDGVVRPEIVSDYMVALEHLREAAIRTAEIGDELGFSKQIVNRYVEPWMHITTLVTMANHCNFASLRPHPDAEPNFQVLAYRMLARYIKSEPQELGWNQWHIPKFGDWIDGAVQTFSEDYLKIATARCARLSYLTFDGDHSPQKDIMMHDRLARVGHWSPFEHCAEAMNPEPYDFRRLLQLRSNFDGPEHVFCGWLQYRKTFPMENRLTADLPAILATKPDWITLEDE